MPRSDAQVLGKTSPADRISEAPPAIQANLSYYLEERPKWIYDPKNIYLCNKQLKCIKYR